MKRKILLIILGIIIVLGIVFVLHRNTNSTDILVQIPPAITLDQTSPPTVVPPSNTATAQPGEHCGGNMTTARICTKGYTCTPTPNSHLPFGDVGGTCTKSPSLGKVVRTPGQKEFNFLIQTINQNTIDGLIYTEYPVTMLKGAPKTIHIGDMVGYVCEGKTAKLIGVDFVNKTATFTETITKPPLGGCPL